MIVPISRSVYQGNANTSILDTVGNEVFAIEVTRYTKDTGLYFSSQLYAMMICMRSALSGCNRYHRGKKVVVDHQGLYIQVAKSLRTTLVQYPAGKYTNLCNWGIYSWIFKRLNKPGEIV